uniref:Uncharacterized protein n=1 Tax=Nelumbo nucifera TaxID=4432 RepID=A0A822XII9_NELNU|nr:TPA_asm: hypothetical protein HUJ06_021663 [Nelumbo nucifera]
MSSIFQLGTIKLTIKTQHKQVEHSKAIFYPEAWQNLIHS